MDWSDCSDVKRNRFPRMFSPLPYHVRVEPVAISLAIGNVAKLQSFISVIAAWHPDGAGMRPIMVRSRLC
jgi:hypothetical protein